MLCAVPALLGSAAQRLPLLLPGEHTDEKLALWKHAFIRNYLSNSVKCELCTRKCGFFKFSLFLSLLFIM